MFKWIFKKNEIVEIYFICPVHGQISSNSVFFIRLKHYESKKKCIYCAIDLFNKSLPELMEEKNV